MPKRLAGFLLPVHGVEPVHADASAGGSEQRGEHLDGGGLAGSVGAKEGEDFAFGHFERDVVDGREGVEFLGQIVNLDHTASPV